MTHDRLVEKLLDEIANARAGIAANYKRLWRDETVGAGAPADDATGGKPAPEASRPSSHDS